MQHMTNLPGIKAFLGERMRHNHRGSNYMEVASYASEVDCGRWLRVEPELEPKPTRCLLIPPLSATVLGIGSYLRSQ